MIITNNNYKNNQVAASTSKLTITFQDNKTCHIIAEHLDLLTHDDRDKVWSVFKGKQAQKLLNHTLDGFIIFLSCKQKQNILLAEYFSLDIVIENQVISDYIHEAQNDAVVNFDNPVAMAG